MGRSARRRSVSVRRHLRRHATPSSQPCRAIRSTETTSSERFRARRRVSTILAQAMHYDSNGPGTLRAGWAPRVIALRNHEGGVVW
jgi:hypothetical protein